MRTFFERVPRRRGLFAGAAVIALAAASIAIAGPGPGSVTLALATSFTATTVSNSNTHTCTAGNGDTINVTDALLTGTSTAGDPHLAGPLSIHVHSVYDTKTNVGSLNGNVEIDTSSTAPPGQFHAKLEGVDVNGIVDGWLDGNAGGGLHFTGGLTGTFVIPGGPTTPAGFTAGVIAGNSVTNAGILTSGGCEPAKPTPPNQAPGPKGDKNHGRGHDHH
jgi:hypothetical protein